MPWLTWGGLAACCAFSPISIAGTNAGWVVALCGVALSVGRDPARLRDLVRPSDLDGPFLAFILATLVSVFLSRDLVASVVESRALGLVVIYFLFARMARAPEQRRLLLGILCLSACVSCLYGWGQFLFGWDLLGHYKPETRKVGGFLGLHLTFGEYLAQMACVFVGLWGGSKRRAFKAAGVAAAVLMASGVVISGAKGAFLGLLAGLFTVFALRGRRSVVTFLLGLLLVVGAANLWSWQRTGASLVSQFRIDSGTGLGPAASNTQRLYMWWTGLRISRENLLYGVGPHAVGRAYPGLRHPLARDPNQWHLHNMFVQIGVTRGLLGLAALVYLLSRCVSLCRGRMRFAGTAVDRGLAAGVIGGLVSFLVAGMTEYTWGDSEILMLVYMLLGLVAACPVEGRAPAGARDPDGPGEASWARGPRTRVTGLLRIGLLLLSTVGVGALALATAPGPGAGRATVWEAGTGLLLAVLCARRAGGRGEGAAWRGRWVAWLAAAAAYGVVRGLWGAETILPARGAGWILGLAGVVHGLLPVLWAVGRRRPAARQWRGPDLAVWGAFALWSCLAALTYGLLVLAGWPQPLGESPFLRLLPSLTVCLGVFSVGRAAYRDGRPDRACGVLLGLLVFVHAVA